MPAVKMIIVMSLLFLQPIEAHNNSCYPYSCPREFIPLVMDGFGYAETIGAVVDEMGAPLEVVIVALCKILCDRDICFFVLDAYSLLRSDTDTQGKFYIERVPSPQPIGWVIAIGQLGGHMGIDWRIISTPDKKPMVWITRPGETLDTGVLWVWRNGLMLEPGYKVRKSELRRQ